MPLADSRLRKPLGDWAKLADPTRIDCAWVSHYSNRYAEIQRDPPPPPLGASPARPPARPSWTDGCGVLPARNLGAGAGVQTTSFS